MVPAVDMSVLAKVMTKQIITFISMIEETKKGKLGESDDKFDDPVSLSSTCSSVNVDDLWNFIPHCSSKQALLVMCLIYTLMQRGVLGMYVTFAQLRPNHMCDQGNDVLLSSTCANVKVLCQIKQLATFLILVR